MSYFTLKNGGKLYYEDMGQGPDTLIMLHGWTNTHEIYQIPEDTLKEKLDDMRIGQEEGSNE